MSLTRTPNFCLLPLSLDFPGWISPGIFALQGLVLIAFMPPELNWQMTRHSGKLEDEITSLQRKLKDRDKQPGRNHFGHAGGDQKNFATPTTRL